MGDNEIDDQEGPKKKDVTPVFKNDLADFVLGIPRLPYQQVIPHLTHTKAHTRTLIMVITQTL
eukprot:TRINITY_DN11360_c0_g1_i1.p1 TRINITY_DN11360_c0_g1~~TRINITY_DN11360_c0_g1_i1.p1  ORF type:complete len:63 (-),score=9.27 TRINITY_DN11360_c0_g1_i1:608-796(-)